MDFLSTTGAAIAKWAAVKSLRAWWRRMTNRPVFYPDRATLNRESPLAEKIRTSERIYAIWFTGTKAIAEIPEVNRVERLLLPNPQSKSLQYYQAAMDETRNISNEICDTTWCGPIHAGSLPDCHYRRISRSCRSPS